MATRPAPAWAANLPAPAVTTVCAGLVAVVVALCTTGTALLLWDAPGTFTAATVLVDGLTEVTSVAEVWAAGGATGAGLELVWTCSTPTLVCGAWAAGVVGATAAGLLVEERTTGVVVGLAMMVAGVVVGLGLAVSDASTGHQVV